MRSPEQDQPVSCREDQMEKRLHEGGVGPAMRPLAGLEKTGVQTCKPRKPRFAVGR